ncbi:MAG: response regulator transcription factor [Nocardioides sp.]|uniref:response regulator transcription factor n=1 Tax=Nocardioides sp. TaxID=35761 RepID=UPI0039E38817
MLPKIRVLLVDDNELIRLTLRSHLDREPAIEVVGEAATFAQGCRLLTEARPDVCVIDVELPDGSGVELCRRARDLAPAPRTVVFTTYDDDETVASAILAGACGYVLKQNGVASLVDGLRLVASGHTLIDPIAAARVVVEVQARRHARAAVAELTPRQRLVLDMIAEDLTDGQIAGELQLAEKTVRNHTAALFTKLGVTRRSQAAALARRVRHPGEAGIPRPRCGT